MHDVKDCFGQNAEGRTPVKTNESIDTLLKKQRKYATFCTPGHKGKIGKADVTEFGGGDIFPSTSVENSERAVAGHYGVKHLRFLTGGASIGIKAAILAADRTVVAPSFTHRSVSEGATLSKREYITFDTGEADGLARVPTPADYEMALEGRGECLIVVTSPDYFGRVADVEGISSVAKKHNAFLLVDAAHGAHFASRPDLFPVGGEKTADFAVLSAHKTLRAYTQSAFGACNKEELVGRYDEALTLLGTTSPSYPMLSALYQAVEYEKSNARRYDGLKRELDRLHAERLKNDDCMRLVVRSDSAEKLFYALVKRGFMPETYYGNYCVFIVTLSDTPSGVKRLVRAIEKASEEVK